MFSLLAWTPLGLFWPTWTQRANRQGILMQQNTLIKTLKSTILPCDPGLPFGLQWNAFHTRRTNRVTTVPCAWTKNCLLLSAWPQSDTNEKNLNQFIGSDGINHNTYIVVQCPQWFFKNQFFPYSGGWWDCYRNTASETSQRSKQQRWNPCPRKNISAIHE